MIKVLHELSALDGGGVAKLLYDYYLHIDRDAIHFDFLIYDYYKQGIYEEPIKQLGANIFKLPTHASNPRECTKLQNEIIKNGHYDVVHSHTGIGSFRILRIAAKYNVEKRIAHSHIAYEPYPLKARLFNHIKRCLIKYYATDLFACGTDAGKFMWGEAAFKANKVKIMTNAIDAEAYRFSQETRKAVRDELQVLDSTFVIGIVGRLSEQKNFPFLFRVLVELLKKRKDVLLLIVGRGLEESKIKEDAEALGLNDHVLFLGVRNDVPRILNAFDVFLLPSKYEGLPVVLVEAQANGVKEIVSDTVTKEMTVTDLITFLPIESKDIGIWVQELLKPIEDYSVRDSYSKIVSTSGYDIGVASKKMEEFYKTHDS